MTYTAIAEAASQTADRGLVAHYVTMLKLLGGSVTRYEAVVDASIKKATKAQRVAMLAVRDAAKKA